MTQGHEGQNPPASRLAKLHHVIDLVYSSLLKLLSIHHRTLERGETVFKVRTIWDWLKQLCIC